MREYRHARILEIVVTLLVEVNVDLIILAKFILLSYGFVVLIFKLAFNKDLIRVVDRLFNVAVAKGKTV